MTEDDTFKALAKPTYADLVMMIKATDHSFPAARKWSDVEVEFVLQRYWTEIEVKEAFLELKCEELGPASNTYLECHIIELKNT